jgi:hypothetical protein
MKLIFVDLDSLVGGYGSHLPIVIKRDKHPMESLAGSLSNLLQYGSDALVSTVVA